MASIPNASNSYGDHSMNRRGFIPNQMSLNFRNHESKMVQSAFITSNHHTNHHGLFSSSHEFNCYQDSHVSSSSFGCNNSHLVYEMRKNMASTSGMPCMSQVSNNPHLSQISITETITNRYSVIVPTNSLIAFQNAYERPMNPNILNPSFNPPNFVDKQCEILSPTPLNTNFQHQNSVFPRHLDLFSFSPNHHHEHVSNHRPMKKRSRPAKIVEESFKDSNSLEEDGEYDGRTHSLPYEKYGPYTCPKCNDVFETSQKFAAHISSMHYKNETIMEKAKRYNARNKKRLHKTSQMSHGESQTIQAEDRVLQKSGGNNNITSNIEVFKHHPMIVKEEPVYDFFK